MNVFNWTAHKALWNWLSKNPGKRKSDWPGWEENGGRTDFATSFCFACEYSGQRPCRCCPLDWGEGNECMNLTAASTLFNKWLGYNDKNDESFDAVKASEAAILIRDLPLKEGVVWK